MFWPQAKCLLALMKYTKYEIYEMVRNQVPPPSTATIYRGPKMPFSRSASLPSRIYSTVHMYLLSTVLWRPIFLFDFRKYLDLGILEEYRFVRLFR